MAVEYLHICTCVSMCVRVSECVWFCSSSIYWY